MFDPKTEKLPRKEREYKIWIVFVVSIFFSLLNFMNGDELHFYN